MKKKVNRRNKILFWLLAFGLNYVSFPGPGKAEDENLIFSKNLRLFSNDKEVLSSGQISQHFLPSGSSWKDNLTINKIQEIKVVGSSVFSEADFSPIISEFIGKEASVENLLNLRSSLTKLYIDNGYITSAAFIPKDQDIGQGVITVQIVEGKLEDIIIEGLERLNSDYILERLNLAVPLNSNDLTESLKLLELDPVIQKVSSNLTKGTGPGLNILKVKVHEADTLTVQLKTDNNRTPSVGSQRRGLLLSEGNLFGNGEQLEASFFNSDGSNSGFMALTVPVSTKGTVRVESGLTFNEVIERPFNRLDLETESRYYQLTFRQSIIKTTLEELWLGSTVSRIESDNFFDGVRFPISKGANERGETRISAIRFFQEWLRRSNNEFFSLRSQFSFGLDLDGSSEKEPDSEFFHWNLQGQYLRQLAPDTLVILRGELQQAAHPLLPDEQFRAGGAESVRGYRRDIILSDNGLYASAEVRVPIIKLPDWEAVGQLASFVDYGRGWNDDDLPLEPSSVTSVGFGWLWQQPNFNAGLYWGISLTTIKEEKRTLQENGFYFQIRLNPF